MRLVVLLLLCCCAGTFAQTRIVSLAPHTTEMLFAIGAGEQVVAVSDFSDYPAAAQQLPVVASYQGVNFEALIKLQPDLVVVWQGGNKPQDISRLKAMGFDLFVSNVKQPEDIASEIEQLGQRLNKPRAAALATDIRRQLTQLRNNYSQQARIDVLYYMWPSPLMTINQHAWASKLLSICRARSVFHDLPSDYPQVSLEAAIARKPAKVIAAFDTGREQLLAFWQPWLPVMDIETRDIIQVNADRLHRFSPRLVNGLKDLCLQIHAPRE